MESLPMLTNKFIFALEGIAFQPNSKLSQELIAIFNDLKKFPSTLPNDPAKDFNKYFLETLNYFEKVTTPKLQKSIHIHTGLNVEKIICRETYPKNEACYTGFFATTVGKLDKNGLRSEKWFINIERIVAGGATKTAHTSVETADQLNNLIAKFDDTVGRFQVDTKIQDLVNVILIVDLVSICFVEQVLHEKLSSYTSEETTAIILHELGHVIGAISYAKYTNYSIEVIRKAFEHFDTYASEEEKIKFIKTSALLKPHPNNSKEINVTLELTQKLADASTNLQVQDSSFLQTIKYAIKNIIKLIFSFIIDYFFMPFVLFSRSLAYTLNALAVVNNDKTVKTLDHSNLRTQVIENERIADEYVAKHNMSSYLATALKKLDDNHLYAKGINYSNKVGKSSSINFYFNTFITIMLELRADTYWTSMSQHPAYQERIELLLMNQMKMIKTNIDNPRLVALALSEYEKVRLMVTNKTKLDKVRALHLKLQSVFDKIISIMSYGSFDYTQLAKLDEIMKGATALMHSDILASAIKLSIISKEK